MNRTEAERKAVQMVVRCYQMIELAEKRDPDLYDVIYNVSGELSSINPKYTKELQQFAIDSKRDLVNPSTLQMVNDLNFGNAETYLLSAYCDAICEFFQKELNMNRDEAYSLRLDIDQYVRDCLGRQ